MPEITESQIVRAFARVEESLLASMIRNLKRHRVEEVLEGREWEMWQSIQIAELGKYVRRNFREQGREFDAINRMVDTLIRSSYDAGLGRMERFRLKLMRAGVDLAERVRSFFGVGGLEARTFAAPTERLDSLINATHNDLMRAEYATLRKAEDAYRQVIFDAQLYATTGAGTYSQAIDMATRDFLARGIRGITYRNGSRHSIREYAQMAVRTAAKRAALVAEGEMRREWGVHTIIVNRRTDACPVCMRWVGQVIVDDVYSGGTRQEAEENGYALLSEAMEEGLFHPNCRDTATTYFPGITVLPPRPSEDDLRRAQEREEAEGELSDARSRERSYRRMAHMALDPSDEREAERMTAEAGERADRLENTLRGVHMKTGGLSGEEYLAKRRLEELAFKLEGREAAIVLSAIDSNPGRFAGRNRGAIQVNIEGEGTFEYIFVKTDEGDILFVEKTWISE